MIQTHYPGLRKFGPVYAMCRAPLAERNVPRFVVDNTDDVTCKNCLKLLAPYMRGAS